MSSKLSIALVTRNRPASLNRALESWSRQSSRISEIVVSDDSDDNLAKVVEPIVAGFGCRYFRGPRRGLYANRNFVATKCTGSHLLSADDDHEHPPGFLDHVIGAIQKEPLTVWSMGELLDWESYERGTPWKGPGQICAFGSLVEAPQDSPDCWAISDGATVYPTRIFRNGIRFYEGYRFGDSYKEFGCLLRYLGWKLKPLKSAGVIHHINEVGRSFCDERELRSSMWFATMMFSLYYQSTFVNVATLIEVLAKSVLLTAKPTVSEILDALPHVQIRTGQVLNCRFEEELEYRE